MSSNSAFQNKANHIPVYFSYNKKLLLRSNSYLLNQSNLIFKKAGKKNKQILQICIGNLKYVILRETLS